MKKVAKIPSSVCLQKMCNQMEQGKEEDLEREGLRYQKEVIDYFLYLDKEKFWA